jgi:UDP-glucuronate 4-epimerase
LAAQAGVRYSLENPNAYLESNILGFQKVLDFVLKMKIKKFVYASSSSVYGKDSAQPFVESASCNAPESYYAATKKANELMANAYSETHKVSSIGLRFFTVYGPWGRPDMAPMLFTKAAMNGKIIRVFNNGEQKRDFTYIDDIVEGVYRLIVKYVPNEKAIIVNIGNGSPVGLLDFISKIEDQTGRILNKTFVEAQLGDVEVTYADTNKLVKLIDYRPKISLNDGLRKFVDWFKVYYKHDL